MCSIKRDQAGGPKGLIMKRRTIRPMQKLNQAANIINGDLMRENIHEYDENKDKQYYLYL